MTLLISTVAWRCGLKAPATQSNGRDVWSEDLLSSPVVVSPADFISYTKVSHAEECVKLNRRSVQLSALGALIMYNSVQTKPWMKQGSAVVYF